MKWQKLTRVNQEGARSQLATTAPNNELMVVCGGGGYLPEGVMVGGIIT